jgi:CRISPR/Cas system CSM-associated protein Csm2 small subunit
VGGVRVTDERAEKALRYLAETDEECAALKADSERAEFKAKVTKDGMFRRLDGSVADRQAEAGASTEYVDAMLDYFRCLQAYEATRNKRQTEALVCEIWRSVQANQRRGNV